MLTLTRSQCSTFSTSAWNSSSIVVGFHTHAMHIVVAFFTLLLHWFNFSPNTQQVKNYNIWRFIKNASYN
jgi:hypothetical protein